MLLPVKLSPAMLPSHMGTGSVLATLRRIQLLDSVPTKAAEMAHMFAILELTWPRPVCCCHLLSEPAVGRSLFPSLSVMLPFK